METKKNELKDEVVQEEVKQETLQEDVLEPQSQKEDFSKDKKQVKEEQLEEKNDSDKKEQWAFLNKKVNKDIAKAFFAGIATTAVIGLALCSLGHHDFYHSKFHMTETARYNTQSILGQLDQINRDIKDIDKKIRRMEEFDSPRHELYRGSSHGESSRISEGVSQGYSFSQSFGYAKNNDFKIEQNGNTVKLYIIHPEKVELHFEPEGSRISDHYYIEKVENGKTIIRLDETVKVYGK